jgi:hypothetical protein
MRQNVAGSISPVGFKFGEVGYDGRVQLDRPVSCLPNSFNASADGILSLLLGYELVARHTGNVAHSSLAPLDDILQELVSGSDSLHSGLRSSAILAANPARSARGVAISTPTPSRASSSSFSPAKSNNVVSSVGSTSRSRSLPSRSSPRAADPKTRALRTGYRAMIARIRSVFFRMATEGRIPDISNVHAAALLEHLPFLRNRDMLQESLSGACSYRRTGIHPGSSPGQAFAGTCASR